MKLKLVKPQSSTKVVNVFYLKKTASVVPSSILTEQYVVRFYLAISRTQISQRPIFPRTSGVKTKN